MIGRIAGELRLRVASSDDSASSESGSDLLGSNGRVHLRFLKILYSSVWKTEERTTCFRRLGRSLIDFFFKIAQTPIFQSTLYTYIKWHIYRRLQLPWSAIIRHYRARPGEATIRWIISRSPSNARYTLHRCIYKLPSFNTPRLMILMNL